jgi:2-polyprenyl-6-hydroxyphenyl methylase/3-demethylubiquinone-9 3-methyltransferase
MSTTGFREEVAAGQRFEFGKNWQRFLTVLDDVRIAEAERSLKEMLGTDTLAGKTFLDVGSGSGLFSLAAMRLGAARVHSFDYDPRSAACTEELKRRYFPASANWTVEQGSALDTAYLAGLGQWDIVYSWGVLHHTGDMWGALDNVAPLVRTGGTLFVSIYNDQGALSRYWRWVKALYNRGGFVRQAITAVFFPYFTLRGAAVDLLRRRHPAVRYREYRKSRGMSLTHDLFDWLGGYPFEVAKPDQIVDFFRARGFLLARLKTVGNRLGCNEFVLRKQGS